MTFFRAIAILLSMGAGFWGLCLSYFVFTGDPMMVLLTLGPGYVVLAGYLWIAIGFPNSNIRRFLWGLSALVQGAWLAVGTIDVMQKGKRVDIVYIWWLVAFSISIFGVFLDRASDKRTHGNSPNEVDQGEKGKFADEQELRHGIKPAPDFHVKPTGDSLDNY